MLMIVNYKAKEKQFLRIQVTIMNGKQNLLSLEHSVNKCMIQTEINENLTCCDG